jgi:DNA modification methylase
MTELSWQGKYNKEGKKNAPLRIELPFQTIETVNESAQERQQIADLFAQGKPTQWRNRLIWGDKKYVLPALLPEFAGKINLIYIDPPFDTGADFSFTAKIPPHDPTEKANPTSFTKQPSIIEQKAYRDTWGKGLDSYLQWFYETALLLRELLAEDGSIYVHLDYHIGHYAKCVLDDVFGYENFRNEIIVKRPISKNLQAQFKSITALSCGHDAIMWYSKNTQTRFRTIYTQMEVKKPEGYWHHFWSNADRPTMRYELLGVTPATGQWKYNKERALRAIENYQNYLKLVPQKSLVEYWVETGKKLEFIRLSKTKKVENWFPPSSEKLADSLWLDVKSYENQKLYATQKHENLLERIIKASSNEGDLVLDCFCGSGTTPAVAEKLNRRWIACDLGRFAIHTTRKRLLSNPDVKPFIVQNLGKYERQQWMSREFTNPQDRLAQEKSYRQLILNLYHADKIDGYTWLHGVKKGRMVHIGAVDAPVAIGDVKKHCARNLEKGRQ